MKTAKLVKVLDIYSDEVKEQKVYRMMPKLNGFEYVLFSSVIIRDIPTIKQDTIETMLFGCDKNGEVLSWSELYCDREDWDHERILIMELGYTIDKLEKKLKTLLDC